jgi:hypothetical protein
MSANLLPDPDLEAAIASSMPENYAGAFTWIDSNGYSYSLIPEGHLWRFEALSPFPDKDGNLPTLNFGTLPGGAYIAIQRLVSGAWKGEA